MKISTPLTGGILLCLTFLSQLYAQPFFETQNISYASSGGILDIRPSTSFGAKSTMGSGTIAAADDRAEFWFNNEFIMGGSLIMHQKDSNGVWRYTQTLKSPNPEDWGFFGSAVSISGDEMMVGARGDGEYILGPHPNTNFSVGTVYCYERSPSGQWGATQAIPSPSGQIRGRFGMEVVLEGNTAFINAPGESFITANQDTILFVGAVYVYEKDSLGTWQYKQRIAPPEMPVVVPLSNGQSKSYIFPEFGATLAYGNGFLAVGSDYEPFISPAGDSLKNAGAVYLYQKDSTGLWTLSQKLRTPNTQAFDILGDMIEIEDSTMLLGISRSINPINSFNGFGGVLAYHLQPNGIWLLEQEIFPGDSMFTLNITRGSIDLEGDRFVLSAPSTNVDVGLTIELNGAAFIYDRDASGLWQQTQSFVNTNPYPTIGRGLLGYGMGLENGNLFLTRRRIAQSEVLIMADGKGIGRVFFDANENCVADSNEIAVGGNRLLIQPGNYLVETFESGVWLMPNLMPGTYTVSLDTTGGLTATCASSQTVIIDSAGNPSAIPDFGIKIENPCSTPDVSIQMPFIRRGFSHQNIYIRASNQSNATSGIPSGYVEVELDALIRLDSASTPYDSVAPNVYHFPIDSIGPGDVRGILISSTVDVASVPNQTLCLQATWFPVDSCALDTIPGTRPAWISPLPGPWDGSHLEIEGLCGVDTAGQGANIFIITNAGDSMVGPAPVRIFANTVLLLTDSIQLGAGALDTLYFPADGRLWHVEVDQHPLHPGNSRPRAFVERCGSLSNWSPGLINSIVQDDADPQTEIFCGVVTASYDPNDKLGTPIGLTDLHIIPPGQEINYRIRFQNTGNDTAFTVIIRDTLDTDLDLFSVVSGASSHSYDFEMYGQGILQWTFRDIQLPDSTTDEPGSNGFVKFKVRPRADIPLGTPIHNTSAIYFDFNEPIITNTTLHTVDVLPDQVSWIQVLETSETVCDSLILGDATFVNSGSVIQQADDALYLIDLTVNQSSPPTLLMDEACEPYTWSVTGETYTQSGTYTRNFTNIVGCDSIIQLDLRIDTLNLELEETPFSLKSMDSTASHQWWDCSRSLPITGATGPTFTPTQTGSYAVILEKLGCQDTSACTRFIPLQNDPSLQAPQIYLFPNPTSGAFRVDWEGKGSKARLMIMDLQGRVLVEKDIFKGQGTLHRIEGSEGLYLLGLKVEGTPIQYVKLRKE